jgi:predicted metal-dependent hydrolase
LGRRGARQRFTPLKLAWVKKKLAWVQKKLAWLQKKLAWVQRKLEPNHVTPPCIKAKSAKITFPNSNITFLIVRILLLIAIAKRQIVKK